MLGEQLHEGKKIFICNCGLGYNDILIAYACDDYCKTHGVASDEILKKVVYNTRSDQQNQNLPARLK